MYSPDRIDAPCGNCHFRGCEDLSDRPKPDRSIVLDEALYSSSQS